MASCITSHWGANSTPRVRLTVTQSSADNDSVVLAWKFEYIATYAVSTSITHSCTATINDTKVVNKISSAPSYTGGYAIGGKTGTHTIASGTIEVAKGKSAKNVAFSCSMDFTGITWSGSYKGSNMTASGTISIGAKTSYTISYNANGGSGAPSSQTKWYGEALTLSSTTPTRAGYSFVAWALTKTDADAGTWYYKAGSSCGRNENTTLYAVWKANTYSVTYNANGGSGAPAAQTKTYGVNLTLSATVPSRTNYIFKGWATSASATTAVYTAGGQYTANANVTLYAVWQLAYVKPRITSLSINRCDSAGVFTDEGAYARVKFDWTSDMSVSSIQIQWKPSADASYSGSLSVSASGTSGTVDQIVGSGALDSDHTYDFYITVADGGGASFATSALSGTAYAIDFLAGGKGVAFGKPAEHEGILEVGFQTRLTGGVNGNLHVKGGTTSFPDLVFKASYQGTGVDFNNYKTSGVYGIYGTCSNGPQSSVEIGILIVSAYTSDWLYQEFIVPLTSGLVNRYYRTFHSGTTWTSWKTSMHNSYPVAPKIVGDGNYSFKFGVGNNSELVWVYQSGGSASGTKWFAPVTDNTVLLGASNYRWGQIYSTTSTISASDRNQKKDFAEFDKRYEELFEKLKPQLFKFKDGTSDRKHSGFISQDVEEAMTEVGLTDKEFAGFCKDIKRVQNGEDEETGEVFFEDVYDADGNPVYNYSLRYEEFIALNTHMIQKQRTEIESLKNEIQELKNLLSSSASTTFEGAENV